MVSPGHCHLLAERLTAKPDLGRVDRNLLDARCVRRRERRKRSRQRERDQRENAPTQGGTTSEKAWGFQGEIPWNALNLRIERAGAGKRAGGPGDRAACLFHSIGSDPPVKTIDPGASNGFDGLASGPHGRPGHASHRDIRPQSLSALSHHPGLRKNGPTSRTIAERVPMIRMGPRFLGDSRGTVREPGRNRDVQRTTAPRAVFYEPGLRFGPTHRCLSLVDRAALANSHQPKGPPQALHPHN